MALENQMTIFTDFDKTMVKENSPLLFLRKISRFNPFRTPANTVIALLRYGRNGEGFINAIKRSSKKERLETANKVVRMLTLKREWKHQFMNLTLKYPNIKNIKLVIITRNIRIIPDLFMKLYVRKIEKSSGVSSDGKFRFRGDYKVIGNDVRGFSVASDPTGKIARLAEIINKSRDKEKYIKDKNAFYFGDEEDYDELVNHSGLKKLHFYSV
jgi:hypothetical protein